MTKKNTVTGLHNLETLKIRPNEYGTDEVANRPHAYLEENDKILEAAIENMKFSDLADVVNVSGGPHADMPLSGDEYTPHFMSRTGPTSADWNSDTLTQQYIDHCHPALTSDGLIRVGDGFWFIQDSSLTVQKIDCTQNDYAPLVPATTHYIYGSSNPADPVKVTTSVAQAYANIPIAMGYSTDGVTFDNMTDIRPIYTPATLSDLSSPSGAIIAQYAPWSLTFTINSANSGTNNIFTFNEPYLAGKALLNVYHNGLKQPVRDINNATGAYTELDPFSIMYHDNLEVGDILVLHSDLGYIRNVGINADFTPGSIAMQMAADQSVGYIEELPFNFPAGMHMLHIFRNGVRLTSGLDYEEGANGVLDNKSITFKIQLKQGDIMVYHSPSTFVTNISLSGDSFTSYEVMHGASDGYKNYALSVPFDGVNQPSLSGALSGMHFSDIDVVSSATSGTALPIVTEFDMSIGIASVLGSYENVGEFAGQINWGETHSLIEGRAMWSGYNQLSSIAAASAFSIMQPDQTLLSVSAGDAVYGIQVDYQNRRLDHIGLISLEGASGLSGGEHLLSTLELKNFRNRAAGQFTREYAEWRSFNTSIPNTAMFPKSLVGYAWSIFNDGYPSTIDSMEAASASFPNDISTELTVVAQNYEEASKKDAHLDSRIILDWVNEQVYVSGTLKSHKGKIFSISNVFSMGLASTDYNSWFNDESGSSSVNRPYFTFNINTSTRAVNILFSAGSDGFEATNTSKWTFTTVANKSKVESIPALEDRLTVPGAHYMTTTVTYTGKIDNTGTPITYGIIDSSRSIEGYNTTESVELDETTMLPITVPADTDRTIIFVKTKQFAIYDGNYRIMIDWNNNSFEVTYEALLIRDDGFNIIGKETGVINTYLLFGQNSNYYKYDEVGTTYPDGNQGNPELPTVIADQISRIGALDVQYDSVNEVKTITTLPIVEAQSVNPSYFDIQVNNYKSLN